MSEATANREPEPGLETSDPPAEDRPAEDRPAEDRPAGDVPEWDSPAPGPPDPTAVESVVNALLEAGPDVAEHVVRAAQELLLAAQSVVDAAERAVEEQQALRRPPEAGAGGADPSAPTATVHHLDVGE